MSSLRGRAMRFIAATLIVAQALAPATALAQSTRSAAPPAPVPAAKGPAPAQSPTMAAAKGGAAERRLALVVGNNTYKSAPLVNPINDARLVAKTLTGLGFEVILRENLNLTDFKAAMRQFASRLENEEGTGLLYYAGHGVQIEGRNFLLPIDVGTGDEYELRDSAVDLEDTLMSRLVRARKRDKIIILDACRDNPFRAPNQQSRAMLMRGFAQMGSEKGSLIVFSTSPGKTAEDGTGNNSVFTEVFVREIQKEGVDTMKALVSVASGVDAVTKGRQTPWFNSSLLGDFYFRPVNQRDEEERQRKEVQQRVDEALKDVKRDEAGRIEAAVAARIAERERAQKEREREYNEQIAQMKGLLERRDKDLEAAKLQMASAARTRDEQIAALGAAEADRRRLEQERAKSGPAAQPAPQPAPQPAVQPAREQEDAAKKRADAERAANEAREREAREREVRAERERLQKLEAQRQAAADKAEREEAERQKKATAEIARREAAAKSQREKEERDRMMAEEARRKEAEQVRREESARQAKAAAEQMRVFEEQARLAAAERKAAEDAAARVAAAAAAAARKPAPAPAQDNAEAARLAAERVKRAREEAERATREAETRERLARIEEEVRRKASLDLEMVNRKSMLPPELAALMTVAPQKAVVAGSSGDFTLRGVRLPADVAIKPAAPGVPANCAAFLGAWGGGRWNGERTAEIWVESVDADCRGRAIYARGGNSLSGEAATQQRGEVRISGDRLTLELGAVKIELVREGAGMAGRWSSGVNFATARFTRMPPLPERTVELFANEALDYGAAPSRVISTNQVSDRAMLPLPMVVPGVDTLTTVQLAAFLKSHPEAVLVDAVVGNTHQTVPGAYWMPELGVVTLGQFERGKIETAMQAATGGDRSRPVIVFERSSIYGWFGYHGVLRLLGMGYSNIYWYRGGLDAWHDAQFGLAPSQMWSPAR